MLAQVEGQCSDAGQLRRQLEACVGLWRELVTSSGAVIDAHRASEAAEQALVQLIERQGRIEFRTLRGPTLRWTRSP